MRQVLIVQSIICSMTLLAASSSSSQTIASGRKVFDNSVVALPNDAIINKMSLQVSALGPDDLQDQMEILFALQSSEEYRKALEQAVAKGEIIPADKLKDYLAVPQEDFDKLKGWLTSKGFKVTYTSPNRTGIYARASTSTIAEVLHVTMVRVTRDGVTYNAAKDAPSLPVEIGAPVMAIIGLQPFRHATKKAIPMPKPLGMSKNAPGQPPYLVGDILKAYNADSLQLSGKGETIAILIDRFPSPDDLKMFWQTNNLPVTPDRIVQIDVGGGAAGQPPEGEESLDVQWTSGIAPDATVRVYGTGTLQFTDLDKALDRLIEDLQSDNPPIIHQLSISLGLGESYMPGGATGEAATENARFLTLTAVGVNVFVSSGDGGSNPNEMGRCCGASAQVEYQASDNYTIAVGGTSLRLDATGAVSSETAWVGSGGGLSTFFARPAWQTATGMVAGNQRLVPDVSAVADPNTGVLIILNGSQVQMGGTSASAPIWAGFCALMNQARAQASKPPLPYLPRVVYPLQNTCFRDIISGSNGAYSASPGFDLVTGLGTANMQSLVDAITK